MVEPALDDLRSAGLSIEVAETSAAMSGSRTAAPVSRHAVQSMVAKRVRPFACADAEVARELLGRVEYARTIGLAYRELQAGHHEWPRELLDG